MTFIPVVRWPWDDPQTCIGCSVVGFVRVPPGGEPRGEATMRERLPQRFRWKEGARWRFGWCEPTRGSWLIRAGAGFGWFDADPWEIIGQILGAVPAFEWIDNDYGWAGDVMEEVGECPIRVEAAEAAGEKLLGIQPKDPFIAAARCQARQRERKAAEAEGGMMYDQPPGLQTELTALSRPARDWVLFQAAEIERLRTRVAELDALCEGRVDLIIKRLINETRCAEAGGGE